MQHRPYPTSNFAYEDEDQVFEEHASFSQLVFDNDQDRKRVCFMSLTSGFTSSGDHDPHLASLASSKLYSRRACGACDTAAPELPVSPKESPADKLEKGPSVSRPSSFLRYAHTRPSFISCR
jgi:hypothetical protein